MRTVTAADANRQFSRLLREATQGEVFVVVSRGRPVATIGPVSKAGAQRHTARESLIARLRSQMVTGTRTWSRDDLYED